MLSTSLPSSTLAQSIKKATALSTSFSCNNTNLNHANTIFEYWPKRKFPLGDKEYDNMLKKDHQHQHHQTASQNIFFRLKNNNSSSSNINNTINNDNNSDQIDVLMQIES